MNDTVKARPFTVDELRAYLDRDLSGVLEGRRSSRRRHRADERDGAPHPSSQHLRPGGTISGPTMFGVCDAALFVAILGEIGRVAHAVTTSASINFLRKPAPADLIAKAKLIKLGKRLAVGEVALYSEGENEKSPTRPRPIASRARLSPPAMIRRPPDYASEIAAVTIGRR